MAPGQGIFGSLPKVDHSARIALHGSCHLGVSVSSRDSSPVPGTQLMNPAKVT